MLENDDQVQSGSADGQPPAHLPWDAIDPPEADDAAQASDGPVEAEQPAQVAPGESEISDPRSQISDRESEIAEAKTPAAESGAEIAEGKSEISDFKSQISDADAPVDDAPAVEPSPADTPDETLPWSTASTSEDESLPTDVPADPQPPALAYAPAFLAVDEEGLPVPDDVVDELPVEIPSLPPEPLEPEELVAAASAEPAVASGSGLWTIPLMCLGIGIIACCLLIPQADKNRRLMWEQEGLRRNLAQLQQQVEINENFLDALATDRLLAKRLAQRQLNVVPVGTTILELDGLDPRSTSPFQLVTVPPPPPLPEYQPIGGWLAKLCRNPHTQLYLIAAGLFAIGAGMILGRDRVERTADERG